MRILLAEDDLIIADGLCRALKKAGYAVDHVPNGADADAALLGQTFDLLILDLGLPKLSGIEVLRRLRARKCTLPVLILTAQDGIEDRVRGLDAGADDYLTKPFVPKELSARIRALLRRARSADTGVTRMRFADLEIVPQEGTVTRNGEEIHLTKTEFRLLVELAANAGRVFSREALLEKVWGHDYFGDGRLVDVHIRRLRTKVEADPAEPRYVVTVRGLGYKLQP